jgi:hypothetical protein
MIACELCSGRHHTSVCAIGKASIEACLSGTPDDYRPPVLKANETVVVMFDSDAYRRRVETARKYRWLEKRRAQ